MSYPLTATKVHFSSYREITKLIFFMFKYQYSREAMATPAYNWRLISSDPKAIRFLLLNIDKIDKHYLNLNPNAYQILLKHPELIDWTVIQYNTNNTSIYYRNPHKITWIALERNPKLQRLVRTNFRKVQW